jgi:hydroxymethylpyrimidine pyrophosphatase-like HAD family hydrolase
VFEALAWLAAEYKTQWNLSEIKTIAIGDSGNDVAMLEKADLALIIRSPVHAPPKLKRLRGFFISEEFGPRGWNSGLRKIL